MVKHGDISWSPDGKYIIFKSGEILKGFGDGGRVIAPEKYWALDWKNNEQFPLFVEPWHFACNSC
ncbi:MAG: PD40 domain-containing protein [Chloroflexi bacterium]|nr:PD40 domain-containing protein [Chloroflexota bacterium]